MKYTVTPCDFDYNTKKQIIEDLIKEYPFLNVNLIGRTNLGRSIFSLSLGSNKNGVIYIGSVRGSDGLSGLLLLLFIERLCHSIKFNHTIASVNMRKPLSLSGVTVVPCLNPDGREIFLHGAGTAKSMESFVSCVYSKERHEWNANAMGVDINRNFIFPEREMINHNEAPSCFSRGDFPESEAETRALTRLCRLKKFRQCIELCRGDNQITYKSNEGEPSKSQMMAKILSSTCFMPISTEGNSQRHGIMDWFIREFQRPAFTLELSGAEQELYKAYGILEEALTVFSLL